MGNLGAGLQAGSQFLGSVVNAISTGVQNKKNRKFATEQADKEYARNLEMWNMQNAYNDPGAQMQRLKDAGMNPYLMYDKGTTGVSTSMPSYNAPKWQGQAPKIQVPAMMNMYYDLQNKKQINDNLKAQKEATDQKSIGQSILNNILGIKAHYAGQMGYYSLEAGKENVRRIRQGIDQAVEQTNVSRTKYEREKFKLDFLQEHGYDVDATPGMWDSLYELFRGTKEWLRVD